MFQVIATRLRKQNVTGIATIHHPLSDVDPSSGDVRLRVKISDFIDRAAVNSHANAKLGMIFKCLANLECA